MGLRTRLWLVVGVLALVPLLVGGIAAIVAVSRTSTQRAYGELGNETAAVDALLVARCQGLTVTARSLGAEAVSSTSAAAATAVVDATLAPYAALLRADGSVVAQAGTKPSELAGMPSCSGGPAAGGALAAQVSLSQPTEDGATRALVAIPLDAALLNDLASQLGLEQGNERPIKVTAVGSDGRPVASTASAAVASAVAGEVAGSSAGIHKLAVAGWLAYFTRSSDDFPFTIVLAQERPDQKFLQGIIAACVLVVAAVGLALGWRVARQLTQPLAELTAAAERVADGDLSQTLPVRSHDETGRLAAAFNEMTYELQGSMSALARSRDDLRSSLVRLGGALGSTHDVPALMQVVLDSAVALTGATGGAAWVGDGTRPLQLVASTDPHGQAGERVPPDPRPVDADVNPGAFARSVPTSTVRVEGGRLVVSLSRGRVVGVLELDAPTGGELPADVAEPLRALAGQAGIAIDNVLLHQEAQQASITDPLTGLGNFRYMSSNLAREIERATRFGRPLAVLMLDLDHFKSVNDTYGHARGDGVLRELAHRVTEQVREVDTVARYGGEEFVLVLPETDLEGATMLAGRICAAVRREPFRDEQGDGAPITVTLSIGVAAFPEHGSSPATLMRAADAALYAAKSAGRDQWRAAAS